MATNFFSWRMTDKITITPLFPHQSEAPQLDPMLKAIIGEDHASAEDDVPDILPDQVTFFKMAADRTVLGESASADVGETIFAKALETMRKDQQKLEPAPLAKRASELSDEAIYEKVWAGRGQTIVRVQVDNGVVALFDESNPTYPSKTYLYSE